MFGHRYFGARYWGRRYFGPSGGEVVVIPPVTVRFNGGGLGRPIALVGFLDGTEQPDTLIALVVVQEAEFDPVTMDNDFLLLAAA